MIQSYHSTIHIISLDFPYPANYGGVIDIYHKIRALHNEGIRVILHSFLYGRKPNKDIEKICFQTFYYERSKNLKYIFNRTPFIVVTRKNKILLKNLCNDDFPILFEGLHCCAFINHPLLKDRKKLVRSHNIEHNYYMHLFKSEQNALRKFFFIVESRKLKFFEQNFKFADHILSISPNDHNYFQSKYQSSSYIPAFIPEIKKNEDNNVRPYILFHGNLSISENIKSFCYLMDNVFPLVDFQIKIAGMNPSKIIINKIKRFKNIQLLANPNDVEMNTIISNAKCILLHTYQPTGIKLKLLISLIQGNYCIANSTMVDNTGLKQYCTVANTRNEWIQAINTIMLGDNFNRNKHNIVKNITRTFNNKINAKKIISLSGI